MDDCLKQSKYSTVCYSGHLGTMGTFYIIEYSAEILKINHKMIL